MTSAEPPCTPQTLSHLAVPDPRRVPKFDVAVEQRDGTTVVNLTGELDIAHAADLPQLISSIADKTSDLVLDLAGLAFVDSMGIGALLIVYREWTELGRGVSFRNTNDRIASVFTMTGLSDLLRP